MDDFFISIGARLGTVSTKTSPSIPTPQLSSEVERIYNKRQTLH